MFGGKKKDEGLEKAKELGRRIAASATDYIDNYCSRIVFYQGSQMLLRFAREIEDLPAHDPMDDEANKERLLRLTEFIARCHNGLKPLKLQLVDQLDEQYGPIFANAAHIRGDFILLIEKRFSEHADNIAAAGGYVIGISNRYMNHLLGLPQDEARAS